MLQDYQRRTSNEPHCFSPKRSNNHYNHNHYNRYCLTNDFRLHSLPAYTATSLQALVLFPSPHPPTPHPPPPKKKPRARARELARRLQKSEENMRDIELPRGGLRYNSDGDVRMKTNCKKPPKSPISKNQTSNKVQRLRLNPRKVHFFSLRTN